MVLKIQELTSLFIFIGSIPCPPFSPLVCFNCSAFLLGFLTDPGSATLSWWLCALTMSQSQAYILEWFSFVRNDRVF
jgi:hypothetical protein